MLRSRLSFQGGAFRGRDGFRHRVFFRSRFNRVAFLGGGFYGGYYGDYGGCWTQAWTQYGPQWVNTCGYYGDHRRLTIGAAPAAAVLVWGGADAPVVVSCHRVDAVRSRPCRDLATGTRHLLRR